LEPSAAPLQAAEARLAALDQNQKPLSAIITLAVAHSGGKQMSDTIQPAHLEAVPRDRIQVATNNAEATPSDAASD